MKQSAIRKVFPSLRHFEAGGMNKKKAKQIVLWNERNEKCVKNCNLGIDMEQHNNRAKLTEQFISTE